MALSHLSLDIDRYEIYLDNKDTEDKLKDNEESTASCFNTLFNSSLDLAPLLYLKSTSAELALSHFSVDDLPLSTTGREDITFKITLPEDIPWCNQSFNQTELETANNTLHKIRVGDFSTFENDVLIDYLNKKINITLFYLKHILKFVIDVDVFRDDIDLLNTDLTSSDARLILRYLECVIYTRGIVHQYVMKELRMNGGNETNETDDPLNSLVHFSTDSEMSLQAENKIIAKSEVFKPITSREGYKRGKAMDLASFHGVNLRKAMRQGGGPKVKIETELANLFSDVAMVKRTLITRQLTDDSRQALTKFMDANKKLLYQALSLKGLAKFLSLTDNYEVSHLFNNRIVVLALMGGSRLKVVLNSSLFLPTDETSIAFHFPEQLSYVLGCDDKTTLEIGPFSNQPNQNQPTIPRLTNHVTRSGQSPSSSMRPMPRILYVCSDIVSTASRNMWLRDTAYENCRIIYAHVMEESNLTNKFLSKNTESLTFHRISSLNSLWNSFSIYILDQNFRKVIFPLRTYSKIGLIIKPTNHGN